MSIVAKSRSFLPHDGIHGWMGGAPPSVATDKNREARNTTHKDNKTQTTLHYINITFLLSNDHNLPHNTHCHIIIVNIITYNITSKGHIYTTNTGGIFSTLN